MNVPRRARKTKIVATIGPASWDAQTLERMIRAGADVIRINTAHTAVEERYAIVRIIRAVARETGCHVGILQDLAGPKPRTGPAADGEAIMLERGALVRLTAGDDPLEPDRISIDDPELVGALGAGQRVLMSDGLIELIVTARQGDSVTARVVRGGRLRGRQGVTVPGVPAPARTLSATEATDIAFAAEHDLEYLGVSFVTAPADIIMVRDELRRHGGRAAVVAKIERPEALRAIHEISHVADALMVARGDLGVQLQPEEVPIAQTHIIEVARSHGKPVIIATQMLESMTSQPLPTRAETSDVAHAVLDGVDAVMLSGETATGKYPVEAVEMMDRIARTVETAFPVSPRPQSDRADTIASTMARAASDLARRSTLVNLIAVITRSGYSAREVARERPAVPIVAVTNSEFVANQLALVWGVETVVMEFASDTETLVHDIGEQLVATGHAHPGMHALFVGSLTVYHEPGHVDVLHLRRL
ncbi:pyruvate kinase [Sphaerobacter sp.]|uniref:pyruvate kinase n=1 Tax=Sphaerobacter sp. TaxID=2099654 RepID=UPI001D4C1D5C|nr:pyruvate kinase [Sphaerobacter sp.]MBX5445833.1 pyruvate kinase [Sphaerobacter sp.]